jgi:acylphosphatase
MNIMSARLFTVSGRVQGVGFRNFVRKEALYLQLRGYAKNLADGRVEVLAIGGEAELSELAGRLAKGPAWAEVRHVASTETAMLDYEGFDIR